MGVHLCGCCLQPRQNAESGLYASSFCISRGRSVSKRQKTGVWITEFPQNRSKLKPNSPAQAIGRGNSSRQPPFFRILLADRLPAFATHPLAFLYSISPEVFPSSILRRSHYGAAAGKRRSNI